jgi:hypothetical protein
MGIQITNFAGQNWTITPEALAVNEPPPASISAQKFLLVLTGVAIVNLTGNITETVTLLPDIASPLNYAVNRYGIPRPAGLNIAPAFNLEQWAPFAAVSSTQVGELDAAIFQFAVNDWRPTHFLHTVDVHGQHVDAVYTGVDVDVAVLATGATLGRLSYHITLLGRIVFLFEPSTEPRPARS